MNLSPQQISNRYQHLRSLYNKGQISQENFYTQVQQLQAMDENGDWWSVDPEAGTLMRYNGNTWEPVKAPPSSPIPSQPSSSTFQRTMPFIGLILSVSCGGLWALYTTLRIGQNEPVDCLTPLIMVLLPLGLWFFSKIIDPLLAPLYGVRDGFPRPLMIGAAFALPFVLGIICSAFNTSGYGAMRWTAVLSILGAYFLTRKRQVTS